MTLARHIGTVDTLPPGKWCDAVGAHDGKLRHDVAYRCAGCSGLRFLFCYTIDATGIVRPDVRCDPCGTTQTMTLGQWDDDPC